MTFYSNLKIRGVSNVLPIPDSLSGFFVCAAGCDQHQILGLPSKVISETRQSLIIQCIHTEERRKIRRHHVRLASESESEILYAWNISSELAKRKRLFIDSCVASFVSAISKNDGLTEVENFGNLTKDEVREILIRSGFSIKDGCSDLKPYVYDAVRSVISAQELKSINHHPSTFSLLDIRKFNVPIQGI